MVGLQNLYNPVIFANDYKHFLNAIENTLTEWNLFPLPNISFRLNEKSIFAVQAVAGSPVDEGYFLLRCQEENRRPAL